MNSSDSHENNLQLKDYVKFLSMLAVFLAAVNVWVYSINFYAGLAETFGIIGYIVIIIIYYFVKKKQALQALTDFAMSFSCLSAAQMERFDFPYAILDKSGRILWYNLAFSGITDDIPKLKRQPIESIIEGIMPEDIPHHTSGASVYVEHKGKKYRVYMRLLADYGDISSFSFPNVSDDDLMHLVSVCMFDETELMAYKKKYEDEAAVIGMLYLDNYEESIEGIDEVERSIATAVIDRKLSEYFAELDSVIRKFERDKYIIFMKNGSFAALMENRFQVLEIIKNIKPDMVSQMANVPTASIGIGINQGSYVKNLEAARTCIELALGRGGDQAAVKDGDGIRYFGGKTQTTEKSNRVKARVKAHALYEIIQAADKIVVMGHKLIDADAFGAAIGIAAAAKTLGKRTFIIVDKPSSSTVPLIETFTENSDYDSNTFISCEEAKEIVGETTALMVVDTTNPDYTACSEILEKTRTIVNLDHHRRGSSVIANSVLSYVEPYASSACEMVAEILQYFDSAVKLKPAEADALYAGMILDTDNFLQKTGVRTFEAAAYLRRCGADATRVRKLFRENLNDYLAKGETIKNVKLLRACYAISVCPSVGLENPTIVGAQAANELLNIVGVKASFVLTEYNEKVYISARAIDEVNVQLVMERMGGGGHLNIAGAQLAGISIEDAFDRLCETIESMLDGGEI